MQLPTVELQANDGKHEDGKEEQEADLQERHHGLHDGLQHNLQACGRDENGRWGLARHLLTERAASPLPGGGGPVPGIRTTGPEMTQVALHGASQTLPSPPPRGRPLPRPHPDISHPHHPPPNCFLPVVVQVPLTDSTY